MEKKFLELEYAEFQQLKNLYSDEKTFINVSKALKMFDLQKSTKRSHLVTCYNNKIELWNRQNPNAIHQINLSFTPDQVRFSDDDKFLEITEKGGKIIYTWKLYDDQNKIQQPHLLWRFDRP